ncbi:hypothetical protein CANTEDRAFT_133830 [Yamadazyma tenuis ATCC 10573]|uniref:Sfi1 spindle body domain-containing protein n=1 Tax=Candida tenuis (strain ATCC 10573 / BCRC 21748 / CBS 615 / JCM 9827 / NBRC 10315 / NRRL Y-1498 / VKM Y-70) TaxID=590646 RepID=G3B1S8_CANTC|nr:uncharacterized protein CANTEDRAFT_133830 [Yamadazyma tenuis ATCC 10573]EGV64522.1 hypothetical protein CANTEDRAFT_133830 [Yamadazyma tenuis ATCC 10573]
MPPSERSNQLNEVIHGLYEVFFGSQTLSESQCFQKLSTVSDQLLWLLEYKEANVTKLELKGTYNKYFSDELSLNMYHIHKYEPDSIIFSQSTIFDTIRNTHLHPLEESHLSSMIDQLNVIKDQYSSLEGYSKIVQGLEKLVHFYSQLVSESEVQLVRFLNKNFNNELRQLSNLQLQLEELDIYLEESSTREISSYIESLPIHTTRPESPSTSLDNHSMYQGFQNKSGFESSDTNFKNLVYLFLQISSFKFKSSPSDHDFSSNIKLMLAIYRRNCHINWMEIADYQTLEWKLNTFHDFLFGMIQEDLDERHVLKAVCERIFATQTFFPELATDELPNSSAIDDSHPSFSRSSIILPREDEEELLANVERLLPQLNEFNFNFDPSFPKSLKLFISLLDPNQELTTDSDLQYLNDLIKTINAIVDYENDEAVNNGGDIYNASLQFYNLHMSLSIDNVNKSPSSTLLMKYCMCQVKHDTCTITNTLQKWNLKTLNISQLNYTLDHDWGYYQSSKVVRSVFEAWLGSFDRHKRMSLAASEYHSKSIQVKILFSKWIPKSVSIKSLIERESDHCRTKAFKKWKDRYTKTQEQVSRACEVRRSKVTQTVFEHWKTRNETLMTMTFKSQSLRETHETKLDALVLSYIFNNWFVKMNRSSSNQGSGLGLQDLTDKLKLLSVREKDFLLRRFYHIWKNKHDMEAREREVISNNSKFLSRYFFSKWEHLYKLRFISNDFQNQRNSKFKTNAFSHWKGSTEINSTASAFHRKKLLRRIWNTWKLKTLARRFPRNKLEVAKQRSSPVSNNEFIYTQLQITFKKWYLVFKCNQLRSNNELTLKSLAFTQWRGKSMRNIDMIHAARTFKEKSLIHSYTMAWYNVLEFQQRLPSIADTFYVKSYWKILQSKSELYSVTLKNLKDVHIDKYALRAKYSIESQILVHSVLKLWKEKRQQRFDDLADLKITYLHRRITVPNTLKKHLVKWISTFNRRQMKSSTLDQRCQMFLKRSRMKRFFLDKWIKKVSHVINLSEISDSFGSRLLHKKHMVIWYDKYLNKGRYLEEIAQELIDQKELKIQREVLSEWSMKYIKFITRHQQSCNLFTRRWETARLKSIFDLWVYKLQDEGDDPSQVSFDSSSPTKRANVFLDMSTDSIILSESPLAFKRKAPTKYSPGKQLQSQSI